jgi:CHAT domain-containing protein/tetratricopeptide (TPR) repeat protein
MASGLLFLMLASVGAKSQTSIDALQRDFDNGHFESVGKKVDFQTAGTAKGGPPVPAKGVIIAARSLIILERYDEAENLLNRVLENAQNNKSISRETLAESYFTLASLARARRDFPSAFEFANRALSAAPTSGRIDIEYHYSIARILYSSGYDIAAIVWLEKAEKLLNGRSDAGIRFDIFRHLSLAWSSKFNYAKAIEYAERLISGAENTGYKHKYRTGLYDLANILNACGQRRKAKRLLEKALSLSTAGGDKDQSRLFISTLLLNALYSGDVAAASNHLARLEKIDVEKRFAIETTLGRAVIAAFKGNNGEAERYFGELQKLPVYSNHFVPYWKVTVAERNRDWPRMLEQSEILRSLSEVQNFREDLPGIYLNLAKAHLGLGDREKTLEFAKRSVALVDGSQQTSDAPISLALSETYHAAYRLLAELSLTEPRRSFAIADYLKGRVLKDRIDNSTLRNRPDPGLEVRKSVEELSTRLIRGSDAGKELADIEKSVTLSLPRETDSNLDLKSIRSIKALDRTAIVSYFFTFSGELRAYVLENGEPLRIVRLGLAEAEADKLAQSIGAKIRDKVFFKSDGKKSYDKLLAPLSLNADHVVIVPDKALWGIPFHALSPDGKSYLIEQRRVSYSPSVSTLLDELTKPTPLRRSIQVFANDSFQDRYLTYVNREAENVARIFSTRPLINATRRQFLDLAGGSDILHFSMHAQADQEEPLKSFMAFKPQGSDLGKITVEDLLSVRLKKQSLAFLASCETNNVLNGEGLVNIAWSLLGSGSSSVISAQWEANDRSTGMFAEEFYKQHREGKSTAKALQAASIAMIRNKSTGSHEPYFWAAFFLLGDYR